MLQMMKMCTIQNANDRTLTMTPAVRQATAPGLQLAAPCVASASKCEVPCAKCFSRSRRNAVSLQRENTRSDTGARVSKCFVRFELCPRGAARHPAQWLNIVCQQSRQRNEPKYAYFALHWIALHARVAFMWYERDSGRPHFPELKHAVRPFKEQGSGARSQDGDSPAALSATRTPTDQLLLTEGLGSADRCSRGGKLRQPGWAQAPNVGLDEDARGFRADAV